MPSVFELGQRRFRRVIAAFLLFVCACSLGVPQLAAQTPSQSYTVNRALVSSGPPASPPTLPGRIGGGGLPVYSPAVVILLQLVNSLQPLKLVSNKQGNFSLVGVDPDQLVQVSVQYPITKTGHRITAEALDGGQVLAPELMVVGLDGIIRFQFRAAHMPGLNHIALHDGPRELGLEFWVRDQNHPDRNPPVVNP